MQNTSGVSNTFVGTSSGISNTTGTLNTYLGAYCGNQGTTGAGNTMVGGSAGNSNTTGSYNSYFGSNAVLIGSGGNANTIMGYQSGYNSGAATANTFVGNQSGYNTTAGGNTFIGYITGNANTTGTFNTYLGYNSQGSPTLTKAAAIGYNANVTANNSMVLGGTGVDAVKVGIGVTAPQAELEVNGYTKLGSNAPKVKMIKLTGTTSAVQGGSVSIAHGLTSTKILSVNILAEYLSGRYVNPRHSFNAGYEFDFRVDLTNVVVYNSSANSTNVLSVPVKIMILYEE